MKFAARRILSVVFCVVMLAALASCDSAEAEPYVSQPVESESISVASVPDLESQAESNPVADEYIIRGRVESIDYNSYGNSFMIVTALSDSDFGNAGTQYHILNNPNLAVFDILNEPIQFSYVSRAAIVEISGFNAGTDSIPPQIFGTTLIKVVEMPAALRAQVEQIDDVFYDDSILIRTISNTDFATEGTPFILHNHSDLIVRNVSGRRISISNIQIGDIIDIVHDIYVHDTCPQIMHAYSIHIVE